MAKQEYITITGARVNNLKNISVKIPRNSLTVITGVSGSGKSSLAFDTLYAEGQRRFAESLSSFARQFLGRINKPDVDKIEGIPPAIAIGQHTVSRNPRSTVGTSTEIYDYLRILFSKIGHTISPISGREVKCDNVDDVVEYISGLEHGSRIYITTDLAVGDREDLIEYLLSLIQSGYSRLLAISQLPVNDTDTDIDLKASQKQVSDNRSNIEIVKIENILKDIEKWREHSLYLLISRYVKSETLDLSELRGAIESAFAQGDGGLNVVSQSIDQQEVILKQFSNRFEADGMVFMEPSPMLFSFNNPIGACSECKGFGDSEGIDEKLVIPNASLSVYEDCVAPWRGKIMGSYKEQLIENANKFDFPIHRPYAALSKEQKDLLWNGNQYFQGIYQFFDWVESKKYKVQYRYLLGRYKGKTTCKKCGGSRLRKEVRYIFIGGKTIVDMLEMSVTELREFFAKLQLNPRERDVAKRAMQEIIQRLEYIDNVGLGYLTLNRRMRTLSGGESQRINLASCLGSSLVGSLYILDEPSIGLHPSDTEKLISIIKKLRDLGNTIVVVEHDSDIIKSADYLIDIGKHAGVNGGEVVYEGKPILNKKSLESTDSLTLRYINRQLSVPCRESKRSWRYSIILEGAMQHNLKDITVQFPLNTFTVVTGVSGSGKSSLIGDVLYPALCRYFDVGSRPLGAYKALKGDLSKLHGVEFIGQSPMGKNARSNPVTYLKIYDGIRKIFSEQPLAKLSGFSVAYFSFNSDGGRCPVCWGDGYVTVPMQFMADVKMVCQECGGQRFKPEILEVRYKGKSINEILNMSVDEAIIFFGSQQDSAAQKVANSLKVLQQVGLGYIQLGQSSSTLSGGESQRVMLAQFLSRNSTDSSKKIFIFDEPTTGLHFDDIKKLLEAFNALVDAGNTVLVVEHNVDLIKEADWVIDMGPGSGDKGGEIIFTGTPEELAKEERWKNYLK